MCLPISLIVINTEAKYFLIFLHPPERTIFSTPGHEPYHNARHHFPCFSLYLSGICGRLMCCMAYEHPLYSALWKSLPSPGAKIRTENGTYVLDSVDLASESVRVRFPNGHLVPVSIAEFPDFREAVLQGQDWGGEAAALAAAPRFAPGAQRRGAGARKDTGAGRTETRYSDRKSVV